MYFFKINIYILKHSVQELLDAFRGTRPLMLPEQLGEGGRQKEQQARRPLLPQAAGPAMRPAGELSCMDTPQDIHTCYGEVARFCTLQN